MVRKRKTECARDADTGEKRLIPQERGNCCWSEEGEAESDPRPGRVLSRNANGGNEVRATVKMALRSGVRSYLYRTTGKTNLELDERVGSREPGGVASASLKRAASCLCSRCGGVEHGSDKDLSDGTLAREHVASHQEGTEGQ